MRRGGATSAAKDAGGPAPAHYNPGASANPTYEDAYWRYDGGPVFDAGLDPDGGADSGFEPDGG